METGLFIFRRTITVWLVTFAANLCWSIVAFAEPKTISITSNGWHTGIVVSVQDVPPAVLPEIADFPDAQFLEFGWGDAAFYPNRDAGMAQGLAAIMSASPAVMHVAGLWGPPSRVFPDAEVIGLTLAADQFDALLAYLHASFDRGDQDRISPSAPGLYDFSLFYPAVGEFHFGNTCNHWTARGLATAGLDIDPTRMRRATTLMRVLREIGEERGDDAP